MGVLLSCLRGLWSTNHSDWSSNYSDNALPRLNDENVRIVDMFSDPTRARREADAAAEAISRMNDLPEELVTMILVTLVRMPRPRLLINKAKAASLDDIIHNYLCKGTDITAYKQDLLTTTVQTASWELKPAFRIAGLTTTHVLPFWLKQHAAALRHLVLRVDIDCRRDKYPAELYRTTNGMASIAAHFPLLQTCLLRVCAYTHGVDAAGSPLFETPCRKNFTLTSTLGVEVLALVRAFRAAWQGRHKTVRFELRELNSDYFFMSGPVVEVPRTVAGSLGNVGSTSGDQTADVPSAGEILRRASVLETGFGGNLSRMCLLRQQ